MEEGFGEGEIASPLTQAPASCIAAPVKNPFAAQPGGGVENDLAVAVLGHSLRHDIPNRQQQAMIFSKIYRDFSYQKRIKKSSRINDQMYKEAFKWTVPHSSISDPDTKYLVVGLVLYNPENPSEWSTPPVKIATDDMNWNPSEPNIRDLTNYSIYLAVTAIGPLLEPNQKGEGFYALTPSEYGRGRPHIVPQDHVFFFSEFRPEVVTAKARRKRSKAAAVDAWKMRTAEPETDSVTGEEAVTGENEEAKAGRIGAAISKVKAWLGLE